MTPIRWRGRAKQAEARLSPDACHATLQRASYRRQSLLASWGAGQSPRGNLDAQRTARQRKESRGGEEDRMVRRGCSRRPG
jgi:hypothetical protein